MSRKFSDKIMRKKGILTSFFSILFINFTTSYTSKKLSMSEKFQCLEPFKFEESLSHVLSLSLSNSKPLFVLFVGEKLQSTGQSWCPDCVRSDPIIDKALNSLPSGYILLECPVNRDEYRKRDFIYRQSPIINLKCVPTLHIWGESGSLGSLDDSQCQDENIVNNFIKTSINLNVSKQNNKSCEKVPEWVEYARASWTNRGQARPKFAEIPGPNQESVWDYPRPPVIVPESREIIIKWNGREVARTRKAVKVLETSHPPTYYIPPEDVDKSLLKSAPGSSYCEWKGPAKYWTLSDGKSSLDKVAWSYPSPLPGAELVAGHIAFYATNLECTVGGSVVRPQAGGFYGGWITPDLTGPFKGDPGTSNW